MAKLNELLESIKVPERVLKEIRVSYAGRRRLDEVFPEEKKPHEPAGVYVFWGVPIIIDTENIEPDSTLAILRYTDGSEQRVIL